MNDLSTLAGQAKAIASGELSPVDLVDDVLERVARAQEATNAFTHVFADAARGRARQLARGGDARRGALHGVPVAVKELYDVAGAPTTGCTAAYADRIATADAAVVERLQNAGAIVVAKTNQHELAIGGTGLDSSFGAVRNPWHHDKVPGGSSSGSGAAVATRAVALAMGSDTAGSIRHPSSFCGVTGLKTTFGAVSRRGAMPLAPTLDTMGPIAATANDCAVTYSIIAGFDPGDPWSRHAPPEHTAPRKRIALPKTFFERVHPETRAAVEAAAKVFETRGATVEEIGGPDVEAARRALGAIFVCEFADQYRDLWDDDRVGAYAKSLLSIGRSWQAPDLANAHAIVARVRHQFDEIFERFDALLAPSTPHPAQHADATEVEVEGGVVPHTDVEFARLSMPASVAGIPSLAFPVGFSSDGMPIGAQLIGPRWSDLALCDAVSGFQSETDWHARRPPGF